MNKEMMIFSIYDRVAEEYAPPFVAKNNGTAIRMYSHGMKEVEKSMVGDYWLMHLGYMDMTTGRITPSDPARVPFEFEEA